MSEFVSQDEMSKTVTAKADGVHRDAYKIRIEPEHDMIVRGILATVPTKPNYLRLSEDSGLPVVDPSSMHLAQNIIEAIRIQLKSCAMTRELNECIRGGSIVRVPCNIAKGRDGSSPYQRSYMYIDAGADIPTWWPRGLNELGKLHDISFSDYKDRIIATEPEKETLTNKLLSLLPDAPTPDLVIDEDKTPGTVPYLLRALDMSIDRKNYIKVSMTLNKIFGRVGKTRRKCNWSNRSYTIYYKI